MKNRVLWIDAINRLNHLVGKQLGEGNLTPEEHVACIAVLEKARAAINDVNEPVTDDGDYDSDGELV